MRTKTFHGESKTRLYRLWSHMIERAKGREDCEVHSSWQTYLGFKDWALANGYDETKCLCRNGDVGNYEPSNARWDTHASNMEESHAKHFKFLLDGEPVEVYNLAKYCKEHGLNYTPMYLVAVGKQGKHKGYSKYG